MGWIAAARDVARCGAMICGVLRCVATRRGADLRVAARCDMFTSDDDYDVDDIAMYMAIKASLANAKPNAKAAPDAAWHPILLLTTEHTFMIWLRMLWWTET